MEDFKAKFVEAQQVIFMLFCAALAIKCAIVLIRHLFF